LEWTVRGLKHLFDSSKGEAKSKVIKSIKFGGGRWQCLFYPNSGMDGGTYVSLYLSCEPTVEEKENAVNGKWIREGLFKFSFELRNVTKTVQFNSKEACDHSFSYKTANWGWAQFARRDAVYFQPHTVKSQDAFLIICTITASPAPPSPVPSAPMKSVPKDLLDAVGDLLDDPVYSDVEFVLPSRHSSATKPKTRTIWAARRLLKRAEYFQTMFESGFAEATPQGDGKFTFSVGSTAGEEPRGRSPSVYDDSPNTHLRHFEDSDDEDENEIDPGLSMEHDADIDFCDSSVEQQSHNLGTANHDQDMANADEDNDGNESVVTAGSREVRAKLAYPSSPRARNPTNEDAPAPEKPNTVPSNPGPQKVRVIVKDVAYTTYRAVLYYLYTDTILFAPLSSSFHPPTVTPPTTTALYSPPPSSSETSLMLPPVTSKYPHDKKDLPQQGPNTRRQWLKEWEMTNPGRILPCSAKAVYRLADKLDLRELKNRAFQHIVKSLTVTNVAYEVFSSFSATFEDVRKVQVEYFLAHWADIRGSDAMRNVWQQIRLGRHPGFEEVWPVIALHLEFKPRPSDGVGGDSREVGIGSGEV
ncbi:hypothetical protein K439DRAFT_1346016, partial [Ramaria rubella]